MSQVKILQAFTDFLDVRRKQGRRHDSAGITCFHFIMFYQHSRLCIYLETNRTFRVATPTWHLIASVGNRLEINYTNA